MPALAIAAEQFFRALFEVPQPFLGFALTLLGLALGLQVAVAAHVSDPFFDLADDLVALTSGLLLAAGAPECVANPLLHAADVLLRGARGLVGTALGHLVLVAGEVAQGFLTLAFGLILVHRSLLFLFLFSYSRGR